MTYNEHQYSDYHTCDCDHSKMLDLGIIQHQRNTCDDRSYQRNKYHKYRNKSKAGYCEYHGKIQGCENADSYKVFDFKFFFIKTFLSKL